MRQVLHLKILLLGLVLLIESCFSPNQNKHSVILIAVEKLGATDFSCQSFDDEDNNKSGLKRICDEGVRFTHAFTPSVLSAPAMGGILTGLHPYINGLRDNGGSALLPQIKTIPEIINDHGIHTLFIGTSPTLKRHSRLHQGFEKFDDDFNFQINKQFRSSSEAVQIFQDWYKEDVKLTPFFSVIHISNLLFPFTATTNELGENRPLGTEAQMEEFDYDLFKLFRFMDEQKIWEKNYVILAGLNGKLPIDKFRENPSISLSTEMTNVVLIIKPPKGREEIPHQWKVDEPITLLDLGPTIAEIFNVKNKFEEYAEKFLSEFNKEIESNSIVGQSLFSFINKSKTQYLSNKLLLIESAWSNWMNLSGIRYLLRQNNWVNYIETKNYYYNDLIDRNQTNRIYNEDDVDDEFLEETIELKSNLGISAWSAVPTSINLMFSLASQYQRFKKTQSIDEKKILDELQLLVEKVSDISSINQFLFIELIKLRKWKELERINNYTKNNFVSEVLEFNNLNETARANYAFKNNCLGLLAKGKDVELKMGELPCNVQMVKLIVDLYNAERDPSQRELLQQKLMRERQYIVLKKTLYDLDIFNFGIFGIFNFQQDDLLFYEFIKTLPKYSTLIKQSY